MSKYETILSLVPDTVIAIFGVIFFSALMYWIIILSYFYTVELFYA